MGKKGDRSYDNIPYKPPVPEVFGQAAGDIELPSAPSAGSQGYHPDRRTRPKLADRLAVYEDDNPRCQQVLCVLGMFMPPLWCIGALIYCRTPATKVLAKEAGFKNMLLALIFSVALSAWLIYERFQQAKESTGISAR